MKKLLAGIISIVFLGGCANSSVRLDGFDVGSEEGVGLYVIANFEIKPEK